MIPIGRVQREPIIGDRQKVLLFATQAGFA
jgi:hypothetical protein